MNVGNWRQTLTIILQKKKLLQLKNNEEQQAKGLTAINSTYKLGMNYVRY